jgi:L-aspartate oxidase
VHGANRLASNSLLEGLVFAERVARAMADIPALDDEVPEREWRVTPLVDRGAAQVAANAVRDVMWEHAGIARTDQGLRTCIDTLNDIERRLPPGATEETNLIDTGRLIAESALVRAESRGGHFRTDHPLPRREWAGLHVRVVAHEPDEAGARSEHA